MKEIVETEEAYDILKRGPSSNTQVPPDSDSDRGYGKLSQVCVLSIARVFLVNCFVINPLIFPVTSFCQQKS